jgi:sulfatase maturation enzyme AslB (radical SAM superfamily)
LEEGIFQEEAKELYKQIEELKSKEVSFEWELEKLVKQMKEKWGNSEKAKKEFLEKFRMIR